MKIVSIVVVMVFSWHPVSGVNVEQALKTELMSHLDELDELADLFARAAQDHSALNHIDLKSYSIRNAQIPMKHIEKIRESLKSLTYLSVMRGDFSKINLKDTVYIVNSEEDLGDFGIQRGFVRSASELDPIVDQFTDTETWDHIEFIPVARNWSIFERRFGYELFHGDSFTVETE